MTNGQNFIFASPNLDLDSFLVSVKRTWHYLIRMKIDRNGSQARINLSGAIGETTPLFTLPLSGVTELILDMTNVTYINSIGVKHWIMWTVKIPKDCKVKMESCPFVIVSQASMVMGFVTPNMIIESFRMPYTCESCSCEELKVATRGKDYNYTTPEAPKSYNIPEHLPCPKCKQPTFEPDFISEKTFKFLT